MFSQSSRWCHRHCWPGTGERDSTRVSKHGRDAGLGAAVGTSRKVVSGSCLSLLSGWSLTVIHNHDAIRSPVKAAGRLPWLPFHFFLPYFILFYIILFCSARDGLNTFTISYIASHLKKIFFSAQWDRVLLCHSGAHAEVKLAILLLHPPSIIGNRPHLTGDKTETLKAAADPNAQSKKRAPVCLTSCTPSTLQDTVLSPSPPLLATLDVHLSTVGLAA